VLYKLILRKFVFVFNKAKKHKHVILYLYDAPITKVKDFGGVRMKKVISIVLAAGMMVSLVACGNSADKDKKPAENTKVESKDTTKEQAKQEVTYDTFVSLLNGTANKDYFYNEINTIKLMKKDDEKAYVAKAKAVVEKAMADNKIDAKKAKVYPYYKNVNGSKLEKDYVVVYGDDKAPTTVYEITLTIPDNYEPALKETKENKEMVSQKQFADLFKAELAPAK